MSQQSGLGRRAFLRSAGVTALAGAVGGRTTLAGPVIAMGGEAPGDTYDFDTPNNRIGTDSVKWDGQIARYGRDHIDAGMGIADMDFKNGPFITKALLERVQRDTWGYMSTPDSHYEAIIDFNKRRYGLEIDRKWLVDSPAVHPSIRATLLAFSPPGTKVLLPSPTYNGFYGDVRYARCLPEDVPMKLVNGRYQMDFEELERHMSPDTNTLILCNPQNPTGNVWSKEDLTTLGEICLRHRVVVLADEVHCDFVTSGNKFTPFATLPNEAVVRNSVTFHSAAKSFNLAGMKIAYTFSTNPDYLSRVRSNMTSQIATLSMVAQRAAYTEGHEWLDQLIAYNDANLGFVADYIQKNIPLIKLVKPQGTYLAWLDVSQLMDKIGAQAMADKATQERGPGANPVQPSSIVQDWLVEHAKVQLNPGYSYGTGGEQRMRMNCAAARSTLELALGNIAQALRNI